MSSEVVPAVGPKLHRFYTWFDVESAAVRSWHLLHWVESFFSPSCHKLIFSQISPQICVSVQVATILLGLVQVLLSVVLVYADAALPKFFILPLILGAIVRISVSWVLLHFILKAEWTEAQEVMEILNPFCVNYVFGCQKKKIWPLLVFLLLVQVLVVSDHS